MLAQWFVEIVNYLQYYLQHCKHKFQPTFVSSLSSAYNMDTPISGMFTITCRLGKL